MKLKTSNKRILQLITFLFLLIAGATVFTYQESLYSITAFSNGGENAQTLGSDTNNAKQLPQEKNLYPSLNEAIDATRYRIDQINDASVSVENARFKAENPKNGYAAYFTKDAIHLKSKVKDDVWQLQMNLKGFGYGQDINEVSGGQVQTNGNLIEISKSATEDSKFKTQDSKFEIVEWYKNEKGGLEQGFTLSKRPQGSESKESLRLVLEIKGDLQAELAADKQSVMLNKTNGEQAIRYEKLKSLDAEGVEIPSRMELDGNQLALVVEDKTAKYPLTIDPVFTQVKKIKTSTGAADDRFGYSVAISGNVAVVGADGVDDTGNEIGAAYIFERNQGGEEFWGEVKKLTASDGADGDGFGKSVAISGNTVIVGAESNLTFGAAYIFDRNSGGADNWGEVKKLIATSDQNVLDLFGSSVSISGDIVIVGERADDVGTIDSGSAYIFSRNTGGADNWGLVKKLTASDGLSLDNFGNSVSISGNTAIVGANQDTNTNGNSSGSAYIFNRNQGEVDNWGQVKKLIASDGAADDSFGKSVSISGNTAIVGAPLDDIGSGSNNGSAYVFERSQGGVQNWGQSQKLTLAGSADDTNFPDSLSINGDTAIAGLLEPTTGGNANVVGYIYERNEGGLNNWGQTQKLTASDEAADNSIGTSVSIDGQTAIIGATGDDDIGANSGAAYIFGVQSQSSISLTVNKTLDTNDGVCDADCSLREAIAVANASNSLIDASFSPNVDGEIEAIAIQSNGKILIAGSFTQVNGVARNRLARINADGTLDTSFDPNVNNTVLKLAVQTDSKIIIGGFFTQVGVTARNNIARINPDGTIDATFDPNANASVSGLAIQADGKILVGGNFTQIVGTARSRIARLETDGTLDATFDPGANSTVGDMAIQSDGKIVVEGQFTIVSGGSRSRLARLNADGTLDTSFSPQPNFGAEANIVIQPDGKILVGGNFSTIGGHTTASIARLNTNGTADTSLTNPAPGGTVKAIALQSDGKIVIGGTSGIKRFNANGSIDNTFKATTDNVVNALAVQSNDKVLVGGFFSIIGGQSRNNIARLNPMTSATSNVINFDATVFNSPQTITLTNGQLVISGSDSLTINGPGADLLTIDANNSSRIFYINMGVTATINDLTIRNGVGVGTDNGFGGGLVNRGNLTLNNLTITNNSSSSGGGGILNETGTLAINNSIISNNTTVNNGGGIRTNSGSLTIDGSTLNTNSTTGGSGNGGGIQSFGSVVTITNSSILNSTSFLGGGIQFQAVNGANILTISNSDINNNTATNSGGGIYNLSGTMSLNKMTIDGNNGGSNGGGIRNLSVNSLISQSTISNNIVTGNGAGITNEGNGLSITNSTISGNSTINGGAGIFNTGTLNLVNTTIAKNIADSDNNASGTGGGLSTSGGGVTNSRNSIFADNVAATAPDVSGTLTSQGYNLIENTTGATITGTTTGNVTGIDPQLDQTGLQNNGGTTKTIAIYMGGPAIDTADPNNILPTDQRGVARPFDGDQNGSALPDIGAFEQNCIYTLSATSTTITAAGGTGSVDVTTAAGCIRRAVSNVPWITITSGANGVGNGTVAFTVAANVGPARTGTITIAGQTFTVNQGDGCTFTIDPTSQNFTLTGGIGMFTLTASASTCPWTAVASAPWITITSSTSGSGSATITFTVDASILPARSGTITVGGQTFTINQTSGCNYVINPTSMNFVAAGGDGTVDVTTANTCTWTAVSNDPWITVTNGASGDGNGTVSYTVAANIGPARTGTITIAGKTFTVTQDVGCAYTLVPTSTTIVAGGSTGSSFAVNTASGCTWTATTSNPWITITNASGTGDGTVTFDVAANTGEQRTGTVMVNGQTFTITQESGCIFSINPTSRNFNSFGGSGSFVLTASNPNCSWTAVASDNWITFDINPNGSGNASILFSVGANIGQVRSGTITVGGQVFTVNQEANQGISQLKKLVASDGTLDDKMGGSVSVSGDTAIAGAFTDQQLKGVAYIYERNLGGINNWNQIKKLTASDGESNDNFGISVEILGNTAIVGANQDNFSKGAVYIFERNAGGLNNWGEVKKITVSDGVEGDKFGFSISLSGNTLVVSANLDSIGSGFSQGSAYIFNRNAGGSNNWGQVKKISASDGQNDDLFGSSVAISNNTIVIGANFADSGAELDSGAAYIYERNAGGDGNWGEVKKLSPSDAAAGDNFYNVSISGDTIVVGADQADDFGFASGAVYVFNRNQSGAGVWGLVKKLIASDSSSMDHFGGSVSISESTIVIGASGDDDNGSDSGSAYIFEKNAGGFNNWGEVNKLTASDSSAGDLLGASVVIQGNTIITGSPGANIVENNQGAAYIFSLVDTLYDFDGDGKADISVFRPSDRIWYLFRSTDGFTGIQFGVATDKLVPADYDGDGVTDVAVWREGAQSRFYILRSSDLTVREDLFGTTGDDPSAVGDWDGDGISDVAVFREAAQGNFYYRGSFNNPNGNITFVPWGQSGDKPVRGDFDGDGKFDAAVYRPSDGTWYINQSSNSQSTAVGFGIAEDLPVPADYDGDGKTDLAVYRPSQGTWFLLQSSSGFTAFQFGVSTDLPVTADYDGDRRADPAVYRDGVWYILGSTSGIKIEVFGFSTDKPIPNVFIR